MPIPITQATWQDLLELQRFEKATFKEDAWPILDLIGVLTLPNLIRLKVMHKGHMISFASGEVQKTGEEGWITSIGVLPQYRRRGLGREMLKAMELRLHTRLIRLTVRRSNTIAIAMYIANGYDQMDVWERYYEDLEDGLILGKYLW
jgi:ribosomal-protein-alanine N-acetyltransferase